MTSEERIQMVFKYRCICDWNECEFTSKQREKPTACIYYNTPAHWEEEADER